VISVQIIIIIRQHWY